MTSKKPRPPRRLPIGAEPQPEGGVLFRVWAPACTAVSVVIEDGREYPLAREAEGYFSGPVADADTGTRYRFRLDPGDSLYPDPASRYQPEGVHGPSEVVDPSAYPWRDAAWPGIKLQGQVISEVHVGTFTGAGTYGAAAEKLPLLRDVGITVVELMPLSEFSGAFGWGYDGVDLFAPTRLYGTPDDLRRFVDEAHQLGIGVILDVVYNHLGPDGSYLARFSPDYFSDCYSNEWGDALNFDGPNSAGTREFFIANAIYWITEFHFDGLRLDATQAIHDSSPIHIMAELVEAARRAASPRDIIVIAENEPQDIRLIRPLDSGGYGMDAVWNDDLHHSAMVAMTGRRQAYYSDHAGAPQEFISAAKYGFLFQGQVYGWQRARRGTAGLDLSPAKFVTFVQNHDQIANTARGRRFHVRTTPGRARAMTALILLLPGTPMLFQGEEFGASSPFFYFADHKPPLAEDVENGRRAFLAQFPSLADPAIGDWLAAPHDPQTFARSKLDWEEFDRNTAFVELHRDLLRLRREDAAFRRQEAGAVDGAVLGPEAFLLRFFAQEANEDRLLLVNFGLDLSLASVPDPLVAPPEGRRWEVVWSSENPAYGGGGTPPIETRGVFYVPGHAAIVLAPLPALRDEIDDWPGNPAFD